jgi:hypothetical protein
MPHACIFDVLAKVGARDGSIGAEQDVNWIVDRISSCDDLRVIVVEVGVNQLNIALDGHAVRCQLPQIRSEGLGCGNRIDRSNLHHLLVKQGCKDDVVDFVLHAKWQESNSRSWREHCGNAFAHHRVVLASTLLKLRSSGRAESLACRRECGRIDLAILLNDVDRCASNICKMRDLLGPRGPSHLDAFCLQFRDVDDGPVGFHVEGRSECFAALVVHHDSSLGLIVDQIFVIYHRGGGCKDNWGSSASGGGGGLLLGRGGISNSLLGGCLSSLDLICRSGGVLSECLILLSKKNDIVVQGIVACAKVLNFSLESVEQSLKLVKLHLHFSVSCCHLGGQM